MEWQQIDTAPKDGTIVLIAATSPTYSFVEAAYWGRCPRATGGDDEYPWVTLDETNEVNGRTEDSVTHWMPLPEGPKA